MYLVEDETFRQARSLVSILAKELAEQEASRFGRPIDLRKLVRHAASGELPVGGEGEYLTAIADELEKSLPVEGLIPPQAPEPRDGWG
jgi:hypothetical protein